MDAKLAEYIDQMEPELIALLNKWIAIPSVKAAPLPNAPYGKANRELLNSALADAKEMGFRVRDIDGYAGDIEMGEGDETIGILCHLDVVPAGDGWHYDPFAATRVGDRIYGRGTSDDKGPAIAALLAMKAVKAQGIPLSKKVRLILGCDEETGSSDMVYYQAHADMPRMGFSPDATYPVINIEKGACHIAVHAQAATQGVKLLAFNVGERPNVVPGEAVAVVQGDEALCDCANTFIQTEGLASKACYHEGKVTITSTGINGHAAFPEIARNAIGQTLLILNAIGVKGPIATLADKVGMSYDGQAMNCAFEDEISGKLTMNLGIIRADEKEISALFDIRYPLCAKAETIHANMQAALASGGITTTIESNTMPHHVPEESELVQALLDAYHEETGLERKAIAIGGGTYAKCLEQGVAFGALFPDEQEVAHQADEFVSVQSLLKNIKIFANAIIKLAQ